MAIASNDSLRERPRVSFVAIESVPTYGESDPGGHGTDAIAGDANVFKVSQSVLGQALPGGWGKRTDPRTKTAFYVNRETRESSRAHPLEKFYADLYHNEALLPPTDDEDGGGEEGEREGSDATVGAKGEEETKLSLLPKIKSYDEQIKALEQSIAHLEAVQAKINESKRQQDIDVATYKIIRELRSDLEGYHSDLKDFRVRRNALAAKIGRYDWHHSNGVDDERENIEGEGGASGKKERERTRQFASEAALKVADALSPLAPLRAFSAVDGVLQPFDIERMAEYLGVNLVEDFDLLPVVKAAATAPCPPGWEELSDPDGRPYFYNAAKDEATRQHPFDSFYFDLIRQHRRAALASKTSDVDNWLEENSAKKSWKEEDLWLRFRDPTTDGKSFFYYNLKSREVSLHEPDNRFTASVKKLQAFWRMKSAQKWTSKLRAEFRRQNNAAKGIQKVFRGHRARRGVKESLDLLRKRRDATRKERIRRFSVDRTPFLVSSQQKSDNEKFVEEKRERKEEERKYKENEKEEKDEEEGENDGGREEERQQSLPPRSSLSSFSASPSSSRRKERRPRRKSQRLMTALKKEESETEGERQKREKEKREVDGKEEESDWQAKDRSRREREESQKRKPEGDKEGEREEKRREKPPSTISIRRSSRSRPASRSSRAKEALKKLAAKTVENVIAEAIQNLEPLQRKRKEASSLFVTSLFKTVERRAVAVALDEVGRAFATSLKEEVEEKEREEGIDEERKEKEEEKGATEGKGEAEQPDERERGEERTVLRRVARESVDSLTKRALSAVLRRREGSERTKECAERSSIASAEQKNSESQRRSSENAEREREREEEKEIADEEKRLEQFAVSLQSAIFLESVFAEASEKAAEEEAAIKLTAKRIVTDASSSAALFAADPSAKERDRQRRKGEKDGSDDDRKSRRNAQTGGKRKNGEREEKDERREAEEGEEEGEEEEEEREDVRSRGSLDVSSGGSAPSDFDLSDFEGEEIEELSSAVLGEGEGEGEEEGEREEFGTAVPPFPFLSHASSASFSSLPADILSENRPSMSITSIDEDEPVFWDEEEERGGQNVAVEPAFGALFPGEKGEEEREEEGRDTEGEERREGEDEERKVTASDRVVLEAAFELSSYSTVTAVAAASSSSRGSSSFPRPLTSGSRSLRSIPENALSLEPPLPPSSLFSDCSSPLSLSENPREEESEEGEDAMKNDEGRARERRKREGKGKEKGEKEEVREEEEREGGGSVEKRRRRPVDNEEDAATTLQRSFRCFQARQERGHRERAKRLTRQKKAASMIQRAWKYFLKRRADRERHERREKEKWRGRDGEREEAEKRQKSRETRYRASVRSFKDNMKVIERGVIALQSVFRGGRVRSALFCCLQSAGRLVSRSFSPFDRLERLTLSRRRKVREIVDDLLRRPLTRESAALLLDCLSSEEAFAALLWRCSSLFLEGEERDGAVSTTLLKDWKAAWKTGENVKKKVNEEEKEEKSGRGRNAPSLTREKKREKAGEESPSQREQREATELGTRRALELVKGLEEGILSASSKRQKEEEGLRRRLEALLGRVEGRAAIDRERGGSEEEEVVTKKGERRGSPVRRALFQEDMAAERQRQDETTQNFLGKIDEEGVIDDTETTEKGGEREAKEYDRSDNVAVEYGRTLYATSSHSPLENGSRRHQILPHYMTLGSSIAKGKQRSEKKTRKETQSVELRERKKRSEDVLVDSFLQSSSQSPSKYAFSSSPYLDGRSVHDELYGSRSTTKKPRANTSSLPSLRRSSRQKRDKSAVGREAGAALDRERREKGQRVATLAGRSPYEYDVQRKSRHPSKNASKQAKTAAKAVASNREQRRLPSPRSYRIADTLLKSRDFVRDVLSRTYALEPSESPPKTTTAALPKTVSWANEDEEGWAPSPPKKQSSASSLPSLSPSSFAVKTAKAAAAKERGDGDDAVRRRPAAATSLGFHSSVHGEGFAELSPEGSGRRDHFGTATLPRLHKGEARGRGRERERREGDGLSFHDEAIDRAFFGRSVRSGWETPPSDRLPHLC